MLYYAIATIVAFALFGWFVFANSQPVTIRLWPGAGPVFETWPWVIGLVGAIIGVLLEFVFTRRLWQTQQERAVGLEGRLLKARARVKSLETALAEREAELEARRAEDQPEGESAAAGEEEEVPVADDEEPI